MFLKDELKRLELILQLQKKKLINKLRGSFIKSRVLGIFLLVVFIPVFIAQDIPMILSSKSENTETGLRLEFQLSSHVERADVSSWIEQKNWFILNFYNLIRPSPNFFQNLSSYPIQDFSKIGLKTHFSSQFKLVEALECLTLF